MSLIIRRADTSTGGATPHAAAVGPDAQEVHDQMVNALSRIRDEQNLVARHELIEVLHECSELGWDGLDATHVSVMAYVHARTFLELLPSGRVDRFQRA